MFFLYHLLACNKKNEILPLTNALIAHLHSQFHHVFALLISMPLFKCINFYQNRPKIKLYFKKKATKSSSAGVFSPDPNGLRRQNSHCRFLAMRPAKLTAVYKNLFRNNT